MVRPRAAAQPPSGKGCSQHQYSEQNHQPYREWRTTWTIGTYDAKVSIYDPKTGRYLPKAGDGISTMFPDHWSVDRIKVEGAGAFANGNRVKGTTHKFRGVSPSGVKIEWFVDKNSGHIINFYPQR